VGKPNQPRNPDGTWKKGSGGALIAVAAALAISSNGVVGAGSSAGGAATGASRSLSNSSGHARARNADTARVVVRLERLAERVDHLTTRADGDCAAHATGRVREFFRLHPCEALFRALFEVRDGRRGVVRVAVTSVDMPDADLARQYQELIDGEGTGTVRPLASNGRGDDAGFDGVAYASARDGTTVVISQAEPIGRAATTVDLAEDAVNAATSG
jgi:hypothetical protein